MFANDYAERNCHIKLAAMAKCGFAFRDHVPQTGKIRDKIAAEIRRLRSSHV